MGTNYNITPKQFNGSDYDTLYFKNTSQQVLLNDSDLATILGLSGTPNVDEALNKLLVSTIHVQAYSGSGLNNRPITNPKSITFIGFTPKLVIISRDNFTDITNIQPYMWSIGIFPYNGNGFRLSPSTDGGSEFVVTWNTVNNNTTLTWVYPGSTTPISTGDYENLDESQVEYKVYAFR